MLFQVLEYTLAPALRAIYQPEVAGYEYVPRTGPVIFAANHLSFADQVFTPLAARRQVLYFAKAEYFNTGGLRGRVTAAAFRGLGQVAVERDDPRAAAATIDEGAHLLSQGRALGIYPEGTRSPDGRLYKFRTGVARLALRTGAPVVPVALIGTRQVNPPGTNRWHRVPVGVHFGVPLDFSNRAEDERSSRILRSVTDEVRVCVQKLSGQNYVDTFASTAKLTPASER
ncbi:1-acyl-sn-glycerol-3-phosphate acyltransferase [Frankineae bacterium MT45]|nr:1-acyl-sn-glycerol-3-phosphate acyltransferase [Frankineae bacterium MT45]